MRASGHRSFGAVRMHSTAAIPRRQQILQALAAELEVNPGARITTARLARAVGVSEAAFYRHFPSKARMFEALFEFAEESVFGLLNKVQSEPGPVGRKLEQSINVLLRFAELNPGIARVLLGDALVGEHERLRGRSEQFFDRFETQLRQMVREASLRGSGLPQHTATTMASTLCAFAEGRLARFSRTGFRRLPTESWGQEWLLLADGLGLERPDS